MLIGSRALAHHIPEFRKFVKGKDVDVISTVEWCEGDQQVGERVEYHSTWKLNNERAIELYNENGVCSLKGLSLIKRSHLFRDWFFDKHIAQWCHWLKYQRKFWTEEDIDFLNERIRLTKETFPVNSPSLKMSNDEFFDDAVEKEFDHDYLHELVAFYREPLYTRLKHEEREGSAWCERDLWDQLTYEDKNKSVAEEAHVIAIERFLIRNDWKTPTRFAYYNAMKKICTTLTSGWFRNHAIDNFDEIMSLRNETTFNNVRKELCL